MKASLRQVAFGSKQLRMNLTNPPGTGRPFPGGAARCPDPQQDAEGEQRGHRRKQEMRRGRQATCAGISLEGDFFILEKWVLPYNPGEYKVCQIYVAEMAFPL